mgnify:CR=1 FL=1
MVSHVHRLNDHEDPRPMTAVERIDGGQDGNLMDVVLAEHRDFRVGERITPGEEPAVRAACRFLPLRFRRQAFPLGVAEVARLRPCDVQGGPVV